MGSEISDTALYSIIAAIIVLGIILIIVIAKLNGVDLYRLVFGGHLSFEDIYMAVLESYDVVKAFDTALAYPECRTAMYASILNRPYIRDTIEKAAISEIIMKYKDRFRNITSKTDLSNLVKEITNKARSITRDPNVVNEWRPTKTIEVITSHDDEDQQIDDLRTIYGQYSDFLGELSRLDDLQRNPEDGSFLFDLEDPNTYKSYYPY